MEIVLNIIAVIGAIAIILALSGLILQLTRLVEYLIKVIRIYLVGDYDNSRENRKEKK